MKKILLSLTTMVMGVLAFGQTPPQYIQLNTEPAVLSEESAAIVNKFADYQTYRQEGYLQFINSDKILASPEQIKKIFAEAKGKTLRPDLTKYFWLGNYFFDFTTLDNYFKSMSKEEAVEAFRICNSTAILIGNGIINSKNFTQRQIFVTSNEYISFNATEWQIIKIAVMENLKVADLRKEFFISRLASGLYSKHYQTFFVNYTKSLALADAKKVIANELREFVARANPANKEENDWLTQLRVLNTTYSEL